MAENTKIEFSWKRRPSEIRGYERAMYTTLNNGDYIRVDYNIEEKRVRLYVEVSEEKNNPYYSVINNGKIVTERNKAGKSARVGDTIKERADEFATLPNSEVLKIINNNYGISSASEKERVEKEKSKRQQRELVKRRYFRAEDNQVSGYADEQGPGKKITSRIALIDIIDIITGILIASVFFILNHYSYLSFGAVFVFWGIILGLLDIFIRNREPVFSKILFFLISGSVIYIYDYFYF